MEVTYYPYIFSLLLVAFTYTLVDFDRVRGRAAETSAVVIAALVILHATQNYGVTRAIGDWNQRASRYLTAVSRFVDVHKGEAGFTFTILGHPAGTDPPIALREGYPDSPTAVRYRRVTEILFTRYYDTETPRYIFGDAP